MSHNRVVFYEPNDLAYGLYLEKIATITVPSITEITINDAIEFYEIKKYFDKNIHLKNWSDAEYECYRTKAKKLNNLSMRFFSSIKNDSIVSKYKNIETIYYNYYKSFWEIFELCKLYEVIDAETFSNMLKCKRSVLCYVLRRKKIVTTYGKVIRSEILENTIHVDVVLRWYEQQHSSDWEKLYRPKEFTGNDFNNYLQSYVEGSNCDGSYIKRIFLISPSKEFPITDEIRLKAKRKLQAIWEQLNSEESPENNFTIEIIFSNDQIEESKFDTKGNTNFIFSYSTQWLEKTLDYPSILNNFIYLFEYVDSFQMRSQHVSNDSYAGILERELRYRSSTVYPCYSSFNFINNLASLQMNAYYQFLKLKSILLEDVLEDCFTNYLQREFGCAEMRVRFPSKRTRFSEKCSTIAADFESVLKQFNLYVKNQNIDFELLDMSTQSISFSDIPSLVPEKYIYGTDQIYKKLTLLLFSDQCILAYVERIQSQNISYKNLFELLKNEEIYVTDYNSNNINDFYFLEKWDLISISSAGLISLKNSDKLFLLKDLFYNKVVSRWRYPKGLQSTISAWIEQGILITKSTLFSKPESDYLDFILNRKSFNNGLELRNKYQHGTQQVILDERVHECNYFIFLRLFVLLAIKINDDFCLAELYKNSHSTPQEDVPCQKS